MRKILTLIAALSLVASLAVGGSIAYLQDTDTDVNTMTMGSVYIEQHEKDENGNPFADKDMYPGDKFYKKVTVQNTGKSEAHLRTFIAFEKDNSGVITIEKNENDWTWTKLPGEIVLVDDAYTSSYYTVWQADYKKVLAVNETTPESLISIAMSADADNEDIKPFGDHYKVHVLSQAVQTVGFDGAEDAFKKSFQKGNTLSTAMVQGWFGGDVKEYTSAASMLNAMETASGTLLYTGDEDITIAAEDEFTIGSNVSNISLGGKKLIFEEDATLNINDRTLSIQDAEIVGGENSIAVYGGTLTLGAGTTLSFDNDAGVMPYTGLINAYPSENNSSKVVLDGVKITGINNGGAGPLLNLTNGADLVIEEGTVISNNTITGTSGGFGKALIYVHGGSLTMNGGEIKGNTYQEKTMIALTNGADFVMNGGEIANNTRNGSGLGYLIHLTGSGSNFEMNGGKITGNQVKVGTNSSTLIQNADSTGTVVIKGGEISGNTADNIVYTMGSPAQITDGVIKTN